MSINWRKMPGPPLISWFWWSGDGGRTCSNFGLDPVTSSYPRVATPWYQLTIRSIKGSVNWNELDIKKNCWDMMIMMLWSRRGHGHSGYVKLRLTKFLGFSLGQRRLTLTLPVPGPFLTRIISFFTRPPGAVGSDRRESLVWRHAEFEERGPVSWGWNFTAGHGKLCVRYWFRSQDYVEIGCPRFPTETPT